MTAATAILADLESRGVRVVERDGNLVITPRQALREDERQALREHKPAVLALLRERQPRVDQIPNAGEPSDRTADVAALSLYQLDRIIEIAVPALRQTLFIVPGPAQARELEAEGIGRGRIWDTAEVLDLLLAGVTAQDARSLAEMKLGIAGTVVRAWPIGRVC
jgi:hypothetical protein